MVYVVIDTNTFIRAVGGIDNYRGVLEHILRKCHTIVLTTGIRKEYQGRSWMGGISPIILLRKLQDLRQDQKVKSVGESRLKNVRLCRKPSHKPDEKFIKAALASKARYIITTNLHLLDLNPYDCMQMRIEVLRPEQYVKENC